MKQLTLLLTLFFSITLLAQKAPMKFGKVPAEDIAMKTYEADPNAPAVVLGDYGNIQFDIGPKGLQYRFNHHRRIKIFKRSEFDQGDISISYNRKYQNLGGIKAQVITPNGEEIPLSRKDMFDENVVGDWMLKKFSLPNLEEGAVIEYKYELISGNLFSLREWYFQRDIPTRISELRTEMPDWLEYVYLFQGTDKLAVKENTNGSLSFNGSYVDTEKNRYVAENIPALKSESYITTMDDYLMRIKFQLRELQIPGRIFETYFTNWQDVAKDLMLDNDFGGQITKKRNYKNLLAAITPLLATASTEREKAQVIYDYLAQNIEWNEFYGVDANGSLDDAFNKKKANSGQLNLMMIALLKEMGITTYPVLISTRGHGKMFELYPILSQFNHTLVFAELDGEQLIIDVNNSQRPMGMPRISALNRKGWLVDPENPQWVNIIPEKGVDIFMATFKVDTEGNITGNIKTSHSGYSGVSERITRLEDKEGKYWTERLAEKFADAEVTDIKFENVEVINKPLKDKMNFTIPNAAQATGDFIYISPAIYTNFDENPFKLEERTYPVDMPYPFKEQIIINIEIPEGYSVEDLPEVANIVLPNKGGKFQYLLNQQDSRNIQIISRLNIDQTYFEPTEYLAIKNFFDIIIEKQGEQIVLKKLNE